MKKMPGSFIKYLFIVTSLFCSEVALAGPWLPAKWVIQADDPLSTKSPRIRVAQRLPEGDTMTATLTWGKNQVITNTDGSIPTLQGTVPKYFDGISFDIPGIVNGKAVTDIHQTHSDPNVPNGTLEVAAFQNNNGVQQSMALSPWLLQNAPSITIPDFFSATTNLFYGVDLSVWNHQGFTVMDSSIGQAFNITNGLSASLPGFIFSTNPLAMGAAGWESNMTYSGVVTLDSFHIISTPEPKTWMLLGLGLLVMLAIRRQKISLSL